MVGQPEAVKILEGLIKSKRIPHAIMFTGPSGCGKTTLARIIKSHLEVADIDFTDLNCADFRGVDKVREIRTSMVHAPLGGKARVWLIDEAHQLTKDAQNAMLKMLEDTPRHVYFMLCTTEPTKLLTTIKTRCTEVKVKPISQQDLYELVRSVSVTESEGHFDPSEEVLEKIAEIAEGSARSALVLLEKIYGIEGEDDQLLVLEKSDHKSQSIEIARALLNQKTQWSDMAKILKEVDDQPERIRRMILTYMKNVLLGGKKNNRAFLILQAFRDNFFDSEMAGLVAACYEVLNG